MREILFRGKRTDNAEWIKGFYYEKPNPFNAHGMPIYCAISDLPPFGSEIDSGTLGQYTGLNDKNGKPIFEGDVVQYNDIMDFDIQSIVCFGEYGQDGSSGEYNPRRCIGWFVKVDNFTCPDYLESSDFPEYKGEQNLLEVAADCIVIGNIHDNPELITDRKGD